MAGQLPREQIPWYPTIQTEQCTGCGKCVKFCQHGVYQEINGQFLVSNPYGCMVGCSECTKICPAGAIEFPEQASFLTLLKTLRQQARVRNEEDKR
jgi:NAD-dependent dihydropyrimidine dehydrogenase PreA subunit